MDKALVLLTLEPNIGSGVIEDLRKTDGVIDSNFIYGPYDAYAMIEAANTTELQNIVIDTIRQIDGIRSTVTCFLSG